MPFVWRDSIAPLVKNYIIAPAIGNAFAGSLSNNPQSLGASLIIRAFGHRRDAVAPILQRRRAAALQGASHGVRPLTV